MVGFLFFPGQLQQVIGRFLIDHIDPIGVKQVSIAAPLEAGLLTAVIVGIVKFRLLRVKALVFVTDGNAAFVKRLLGQRSVLFRRGWVM